MTKIDLTGKEYGKLTVLRESEPKIYGKGATKNIQRRWNCVCACGEERTVFQRALISGATTSCGCNKATWARSLGKKNKKNIVGNKYGRLTVIKETDKRENRSIVWECVCDCGNKTHVSTRNLSTGNNESCGCLFQEFIVKKNREWAKINRGKNHHNWNDDLTDEDREKGRYGLKEGRVVDWRVKVFIRDKRTCQTCGYKGQDINAHHLNGWNWCKDERFDLDNGVTLCGDCHIDFHKIYGYGNNTKEQFNQYVKSTIATNLT